MTPPYQYDRRRAEDVFKVVEDEVFPRIGEIDKKISSLDQGVRALSVDGCAHRIGDLHRTEVVEAGMAKIADKIDGFGHALSEARVDMVQQVGGIRVDVQKQVGGIKAWVLTAVVIVLLSVAGFFLQKHYEEVYDRLPPASQGLRK